MCKIGILYRTKSRSKYNTINPCFKKQIRITASYFVSNAYDHLYFRAYPIEQYPCRTRQAAAIMLMIMNNLDPKVAQVCTNIF